MADRAFQNYADSAEIEKILVKATVPITLANQLITKKHLDDHAGDSAQVEANRVAIATNKVGVASNKAKASKNAANIHTNRKDILVNVKDITLNRNLIAALQALVAVYKGLIDTNTSGVASNAADIVDHYVKILANELQAQTNKADIAALENAIHSDEIQIAENKLCCETTKDRLDNLKLEEISNVLSLPAKDYQQLSFLSGQWRAVPPPGYIDDIDFDPATGMLFARNTIYNRHDQAVGENLDFTMQHPITVHKDGTDQVLPITIVDPSLVTWTPDFSVAPAITAAGSYTLHFHYLHGIASVTTVPALLGYGRRGYGTGGYGAS